MNERRRQKIEQVASQRQLNLTVILENIQDPHNLGAVLRSCDAVGISEIYTVYSDGDYIFKPIPLGKKSTMGTRKWVEVHHFTDLEACLYMVKQKYGRIMAALPLESSVSVFDIDHTQAGAFMFGNEKHGLTQPAIDMADQFFYIPQVGMVESLNLSVACAVTVYESFRQRQISGFYNGNTNQNLPEFQNLMDSYIEKGATKRSIIKTEIK